MHAAGTGDVQYINDDDIVCCCCLTPELGFKILFVFAFLSFLSPISIIALFYFVPWIREDNKETRGGLVFVMKMYYYVNLVVGSI